MSKMMIEIFSFNSAKDFLQIIDKRVSDCQLENNLFSHSSNPLLTMCLMYELLQNIIQKFYSLNYACTTLMKQIMNMTI